MSNYRLVALDMDGTLLTSKKSVHPDTIRDITEASEKGIHVIYCSGRALIQMNDFIDCLPTMRYAICMSGAMIYDIKEHKTIDSCRIANEYLKTIVASGKDDDAMIHIFTEDECFVREDQLNHMNEFNMEVLQPMFIQVSKTVPDMMLEAEKPHTVLKVDLYFHTRQARQEAYEKIKHLPLSFAFTEGSAISIEITANGVTKANGLLKLASHLNIPIEQTLGIGDGENDRSFLSIVGLSVAMNNASEGIKSICKVVTDDNDHNGTGKAIRKYCLDH